MSKRAAGNNWESGESRYGGAAPGMDNTDKPMQATAAQMANRNWLRERLLTAHSTKHPHHARVPTRTTIALFHSSTAVMAPHILPEYTLMRTWFLTRVSKYKELDKTIVREYEQYVGLLPEEFLKYGLGRTDVKARIAAAKRSASARARSGSPAINMPPQPNPFGGGGGGGMFGGGAMQQPQQQQQQPAANPFTASSFDFNFGGNQTNGTSTNNPFAFGASAPAPSQPQQNGISNMFGQSAAPSFGSGTATSFGTNASQPQQNGFNPSTSMFNQPSQSQQTNSTGFGFGQIPSTPQNGTSTPTTSFGGFGSQAPQSNTNGNVSFNFGGAAQEKQEPKPSTPFASFGQTPTASNNQPSNPFGNLGQNTQQNGDKQSTPLAGFGTQNTQQNGTLFSGIGQEKPKQNGESSSNLFGNIGQQKTPEPEQSNTLFSGIGQKPVESTGTSSNLFGNLGQKPLSSAGNNLFPAASLPEQQTPKPTTSLFSGLSNTPSTSLFNAPSSSVPASTGKGLFGSQTMSNEPSKVTGSVFDNLPPRETPQFGSHIPGQAYKEGDDEEGQQAESGKIELFPKSKEAEQAPPSNLFGGVGSTEAASGSSLFKLSAAQQDTSMTTPSATPQKPLFAPSEMPATQPSAARSLFDRIDAPAPSATSASQPAKSLFDRTEQNPDETPKASLFNNASATPAAAKPMFSQPAPTPEAPSASIFQKPASSAHIQVPSKNMFSQTPAASSTAALPAAAQSSTPKQPVPPAKHTFKESGRTGYRPVAAAQGALSESQRASFEKLNDALLAHINKLETNQDLSEIFRFALVASADIAGRSRPTESELHPAPPQAAIPASAAAGSGNISSAASANATTSSGKQPVQGSGSSTAAPSQTNLFAQTPKAAPVTNLFSQPPTTAPTKKRLFEEDSDDLAQQPATEKRIKPNEPQQYPTLPAAASNTAKLFASTLDKPQGEETPKPASTSGFSPSTKSLFPAPTSGSGTSKPATSGFTPSFGAQTSTARPSGFTPAGGATAGSSFLSSFEAAAKAQEEQDRKKRKSDDYDSDEETEEQWLKRDKEKQEAKRQKIEEAAKSAKGFSFTTSTSNGPTSPAKQPTAAALEKAQGKGDNTWKPETPIKFSLFNAGDNASTTPAVSPPKLGGGSLFANSAVGKAAGGGLFSAGSASTDTSSKLAPPSTGFNFSSQPSSLGVSRATTPGVTTDGEASTAAEGEDVDVETSNDPQAEDQTGLTTEEQDANDVLGEFHDVKTSKFELNDQGQKKWVPKGFGVVYLLKDKETGKTRILSRVGTGKLTLNYNPLKGSKYAIHPKKDTMVTAAFWDHLHTTEPALGQFIMTTSKAADASELARILTEGTPQ
ncbi:uncharacterized protein MYCFIDRAFT_196233 [Pseudocercospora fijiensis CIRAD86]|uniref:RanBD1 domain-containing protein n=1 Tax=Pseudocercospora fijiensis (strain CIRAD86) TaxID=383855 RepID=M3AE07_PSEFD|nr:uncharacterized protein MYCFIDRAFT_196233 [Pseudocercospora fijiensis CIRAD86]EME82761.1 hypothetical protein MYCFIDRAFT_196233 [Pseudocercospora fijiensis CIRAD86]